MKRRTSGKVWMLVLLLVVVSSAFGAADSPSGDPPFGLVFEDGRSGQQYEGLVTLVFRDYTKYGAFPLSSPRFDAVVRLRKGNAYEVFYTEYVCPASGSDDCEICNGIGRIYVVGQQRDIQLCLQDLIEDDVIAKFGLGEVDVRLKDIGGFASDEDPVDAPVRAISAAEIEVTVK